MLPTFQKWTFYKGLYAENDGPSIWGKGARNIYLNYNQMRAYVEYSPNQPKKKLFFRPFHRAIDETLKIPEKCWPFLYQNLLECYSSDLSAHADKMVITTVCVQIDNCFCKTSIVVHQHAALM